MRLILNRLLLLAVGASLAACSSDPEKPVVKGPADLPSYEEEVDLDRVWSMQIGDGMGTAYARIQPALEGKNFYISDAKGLVQAYELEDADLVWEHRLEEEITAGVGVYGDKVYLATSNGEVHALNKSDGQRAWRSMLKSEILSVPVVHNGAVAVQTVDGKLYLLDEQTGERRWVFDSNLPNLSVRGTSQPVFYKDIVVAGYANGKLVAVRVEDGTEVWNERVGIPAGRSELERLVDIDGRLLVDSDTLFVVGYQGHLVAIDLRSGKAMWKREASSYHGPLYGLGNLYVLNANDELEAFDERSGNDVWISPDLYARQLTEPVFYQNHIAVADYEGYIHLIKQLDGSIIGRDQVDRPAVDWVRGGSYAYKNPSRYFDLDAGIRTRLVAHGKYLLAINNSGYLNLFEIDQ